jgi:hypothetical protein
LLKDFEPAGDPRALTEADINDFLMNKLESK